MRIFFLFSRRIVLSFFSIFFGLGLFVFVSTTSAQENGFKVEVSPAKINVKVEKGKAYVQKYRIGNYSNIDQTFSLYVKDFRVINGDGKVEFIETENKSSIFSLSHWVELPFKEIFVPSGEVREVDVKITAPNDATVGGHYGALFVQTRLGDKENESAVGSLGRIGALMLVSVPGDISESLHIKSLNTDKSIYFNPKPHITFTTVFQNDGNVHQIPTGAYFTHGGWFTEKSKAVIFNADQSAVLPSSPDRAISDSYDVTMSHGFIPPMGKITVEFAAKYGTQYDKELSGHTSFWLIPIKFLLTVCAIVIVFLFIVYRAYLSYRKK